MYVLGVWDGHDAGAALLSDGRIVFAANEERFTKRKLEVGFPRHSIGAALKHAGIRPTDVEHVAYSTTEFSKTLERVFPSMRENYYQFRRRKMLRPPFEGLRHKLKYSMTTVGILPGCGTVSGLVAERELRSMGFSGFRLHAVEHHTAHAASAALTSGMGRALIITVDGLGDGLSGSISTFEKGTLERHAVIPAKDSIGIFFEQVTNIVGMRELEDEGKVMAMADYSYPFPIEKNRFRDFFKVEGTTLKARYSPAAQYNMLQRIAWQMPREQFAYMAQQILEAVLTKFVSNAVGRFGIGNVAFAGGIFSNVKANMLIRGIEGIKHWYIFPHMGDGGLALGAALHVDHLLRGNSDHGFMAYLGPAYTDEETEKALREEKWLKFEEEAEKTQAAHAAELINSGNYVFWFHGRMEYGPRALGNRSILAPSGSENVKDRLNLYVKKREWFQPFAPSMMEEEAENLLEFDGKGMDRYMTMAYMVREGKRDRTRAVMHIDGSARAQMVGGENPLYHEMLGKLKKGSGDGVVLNTSFNIHGMPIVMNPSDAIATMRETNTKYMFINGFFVTNRKGI